MIQRAIKFRARAIDTGKWIYGYYFVTPLTDENSGTSPEVGWFFLTGEKRHCISNENGAVFVVDPKTVSQFTGLLDKNGKEIYEGDIIEYEFSPVGMQRGEFVFDDGTFFLKGTNKYRPYDCEIIGNIYESSNLLTNPQ